MRFLSYQIQFIYGLRTSMSQLGSERSLHFDMYVVRTPARPPRIASVRSTADRPETVRGGSFEMHAYHIKICRSF